MVRISSLVAVLVATVETCLGVSVAARDGSAVFSLQKRKPDNSMLQYAEDGVRYIGDWKWEWQPLDGSVCSRSHHTPNVGAGVEMQFKGSSLDILGSFSNHPRLNITLDGVPEVFSTASTTPGQAASVAYPCMSFWQKKNLSDGDHLVLVQILPETDGATTSGGEFYFNGFQVDAGIVKPSASPIPLASAIASSNQSTATGRPDMLVLGVVIGIVLFSILVGLLVIFLVYRRRNRQRAAMAEKVGVGLGGPGAGAVAVGLASEKDGDVTPDSKSEIDWDAKSKRSSASTLVPPSSFPAASFKMLFTSK